MRIYISHHPWLHSSMISLSLTGFAWARADAAPRTSLLLEAPRGKILLFASTDPRGKGDDFLVLAPKQRRRVNINCGAGNVARLWCTASRIESLSFSLQIDDSPTKPLLENGKLRYHFVSPLSSYYEKAFVCYDLWPVRQRCVLLVENHAAEPNKFFYQINFRSNHVPETSTAATLSGRDLWHSPSMEGKPYKRWEWLSGHTGMRLERVESSRATVPALLRLQGPGIIWAWRFPLSTPLASKSGWLKVSWDGQRGPAIDVPVSSFVGQTFAVTDYASAFAGSQDGYGYCCFPMPFHEATIAVSTDLPTPCELLWQPMQFAPAQRFYAVHSQEVTRTGSPFHLTKVAGKGYLVGVSLAIDGSQRQTFGFLEGNEIIMADDTRLEGTGTEDFFNSAWYFPKKPFCFPLHGLTYREEARHRIEAYRWMLPDRIPFDRELTVQLEHGRHNGTAGCVYEAVTSFYADPATVKCEPSRVRIVEQTGTNRSVQPRAEQRRIDPRVLVRTALILVIAVIFLLLRSPKRKKQ